MMKNEERTKPAIRIKQALDFHHFAKPKARLQEIDLAREIYLDGKPIVNDKQRKTLSVKMSNLKNGKISRVEPAWVRAVCKALGVDANFLFGVDPMDDKLLTKFLKSKKDECN